MVTKTKWKTYDLIKRRVKTFQGTVVHAGWSTLWNYEHWGAGGQLLKGKNISICLLSHVPPPILSSRRSDYVTLKHKHSHNWSGRDSGTQKCKRFNNRSDNSHSYITKAHCYLLTADQAVLVTNRPKAYKHNLCAFPEPRAQCQGWVVSTVSRLDTNTLFSRNTRCICYLNNNILSTGRGRKKARSLP